MLPMKKSTTNLNDYNTWNSVVLKSQFQYYC